MYQQKRFKPTVEFFINELDGPNDFSQRDQDIARIVPKMSKFLPEKALQSLASVLNLNTLLFISRKPAKMAGILALHEFLEKGFKSFKNIGNVEDFITPVIDKEHQIMRHLSNPNLPNPLPDI